MVHYLIKFPLYSMVFDFVDTTRLERESNGKNVNEYRYSLNDDWDCMGLMIKHMLSTSGVRTPEWLEDHPKSNCNRIADNPVGALHLTTTF